MYVGRISYGWYLWHWPCLVLAGVIWAPAVDDPDLVASSARSLGLWPVLGAVVVSFLLASLTYRVVEAPVRRSRVLVVSRARTLSFGAALLVVAVSVPAVLLGSGGSVPAVAAAAVQDDSTDWAGLPIPGASPSAPSGDAAGSAQLLYVAPKGQAPARTASMTPAQARSDNGSPANCFIDFPSTTVDPACVFGDPHGSKVVVLFGDSNAAQWFPAVRRIATRYGWKLYFWAKPACAFADVRQFTTAFNREFTECAQWRKSVYAQLETMPRIDMIVVGRNLSYHDHVDARHGFELGVDGLAPLRALGELAVERSRELPHVSEGAGRLRPEVELPPVAGRDAPDGREPLGCVGVAEEHDDLAAVAIAEHARRVDGRRREVDKAVGR